MSEACEDRDGRAGGATMLQPVILRLTLNAAAFAAAAHVGGQTNFKFAARLFKPFKLSLVEP